MKAPIAAIRILVVEDHPLVRQGLAQLLNGEPGFTVVGEADSAREALTVLAKIKPDLAIIDVALKGGDGLELTKNIVARWPNLPILVLSMHDEALLAERALRSGARGYLMKQEATEKLIAALHRILDGGIYVSEKVGEEMMGRALFDKPADGQMAALFHLGSAKGATL